MSAIEPRVLEQLSAWMDGELPAEEARFLQRRLANDSALRAQWERWQLASDCLHREPLRLADDGLAARVAAAVAAADPATGKARPRWNPAWLASAAAVALAAVFLPGMLAVDAPHPPASATAPAVALAEEPPVVSPLQVAARPALPPMSPLPSVRDFPLVDRGGKAWPRSPLLAAPGTREGFLVRSPGPYLPVSTPRPVPESARDDGE